ncbi:hypothetical protein CR513_21306, partial [Mucuna pruriens]
MSRKSKRVCFSPDVNDKPTIFLKHDDSGGDNSTNQNNGIISRSRKRITRTCSLRFSSDTNLSPMRLLLRLGAKVASAIRNVSVRRRSSRKVSSSTLVRSRSLSDLTDSHRAETVEDCIEFLHSSSSRERPRPKMKLLATQVARIVAMTCTSLPHMADRGAFSCYPCLFYSVQHLKSHCQPYPANQQISLFDINFTTTL